MSDPQVNAEGTKPVPVVVRSTDAQWRHFLQTATVLAGAILQTITLNAPQITAQFPSVKWLGGVLFLAGLAWRSLQSFTDVAGVRNVNNSLEGYSPPQYAGADRRYAPPTVEEMGPRIYGPGGLPPPPPVGDVAPPWGATSADMAHGADIADKLKDDQT